ncbi:MAG: cell division protein FtsQ/DivIB [Pseudomonadota bacterium]
MARKQARRRKTKPVRSFALPKLRWTRVVAPVLAVALVFASYELALRALDREIRSLEISGPLERVSAMQIEAAIATELDAGFLGSNLGHMRQTIRDLEWIDDATVARRWPDRLAITVTEQVAAAIWDDKGLLNVRGELFVENARHTPAELPRLSGPASRAADVATRYLAIRKQLIPLGLDVREVNLDSRGAWEMTLSNGVGVRLGRRDVDNRTQLFLDVVANIVTANAKRIEYVDLRYSNGFTIGWNGDRPPADEKDPGSDPAMLAHIGAD